MIDPRGEGPGVLLPAIRQRAALLEQLVAATIAQQRPAEMVARMTIPAHGAANPDSNHVVSSTRIRTSFTLITPGGSGGGYNRWELFVGTALFFSWQFQNQGETTDFPLPFVIDSGVEVFSKEGAPSVSAGDFMYIFGYPER